MNPPGNTDEWLTFAKKVFDFLYYTATVLAGGWMAWKLKSNSKKSDKRSEKLDRVAAIAEKIEKRTNSLEGISKDTIAAQAKIIAKLPGASASDLSTADRTAKIAEEHHILMKQEEAVDIAKKQENQLS